MRDGWLQLSGYVLAAVVTATRPLQLSYQRDMWTLIAVSLGLRALGFLLYVPWIRTQVPQPYPSIADVAWLPPASALSHGGRATSATDGYGCGTCVRIQGT